MVGSDALEHLVDVLAREQLLPVTGSQAAPVEDQVADGREVVGWKSVSDQSAGERFVAVRHVADRHEPVPQEGRRGWEGKQNRDPMSVKFSTEFGPYWNMLNLGIHNKICSTEAQQSTNPIGAGTKPTLIT